MTDFKDIQLAFAQHIRDPENVPSPEGISDQRMTVYRELFFNNIAGFISSAFPVMESLYSEDEWLKLARDFFIRHRCETPLFLEISQEFLSYIQHRYQTDKEFQQQTPDFMLELAHYEWVELDVSIRVESSHYPTLDVVDEATRLVFSETASLLSYAYPVQHISEDFQPSEPGLETTFLLVYRDTDEEVQFVAINALTAHLLNLLVEQPGLSFAEYLEVVKGSLPQMDAETVRQGAEVTIKRMTQLSIIRAYIEQ